MSQTKSGSPVGVGCVTAGQVSELGTALLTNRARWVSHWQEKSLMLVSVTSVGE